MSIIHEEVLYKFILHSFLWYRCLPPISQQRWVDCPTAVIPARIIKCLLKNFLSPSFLQLNKTQCVLERKQNFKKAAIVNNTISTT